MKKLINITFASILITTHIIVELYPTFKMSAKVYVSKWDFNSFLNSEPVAKYVSFLSEEEKVELLDKMSSYIKNTED